MGDKEQQTMYEHWHRNKSHMYEHDPVAALIAYWSFRYPEKEYQAIKKFHTDIIGPAVVKKSDHTLTKNGKAFCAGLLPTLNTLMTKLSSKGWETWEVVEGIVDTGEAYQLVVDFSGHQVQFSFPTDVHFLTEVRLSRGVPVFKIYVRRES
jgi:hypothetical protein